MKKEPSMAARSLRGAALAITLVSLVTFSTVAYSAYVDVGAVLSTIGSGGAAKGVVASVEVQGSSLVVHLNVTLKNEGLYPVDLAISCTSPESRNATCNSPDARVPPGTTKTVAFIMTFHDVFHGGDLPSVVSNLHLDGNVHVALEPFAAIDAKVDLGSLLRSGGG